MKGHWLSTSRSLCADETADTSTREEMTDEECKQVVAEQKAIEDARAAFRARCEELGLPFEETLRRLQRSRPAGRETRGRREGGRT